jgi:hypothetical protein
LLLVIQPRHSQLNAEIELVCDVSYGEYLKIM